MLYLVAELGHRALVRAGAALVAATLSVTVPVEAAQAREYSGIVVDARSGKTLYAHDADEYRYPASLTKMMTLYMVFDALDEGKVTLKSRVPFSRHAAAKPPSKIGVPAGKSISMEQAILALVTKSANDVAAAVAEKLGGTEANFARKMTRKARELGMKRTTFRNASGLPNEQQRTTARDMARLGIALREHHPKRYKYFSTRTFAFGRARYGNHNKLLGRVRGVDGIKTGYIRASGYNLVTSVQDRGRSVVGVVIGGRTGASRNAQMKKLIAAHLPKASRRGGGQLIARAGSARKSVMAALPQRGPAPGDRPTSYATALPATVQSFAALPRSATAEVKVAAAPKVDMLVTGSLARDEAAPVPAPAAKKRSRIAKPAPAAPSKPTSGWIIQVAATPTLDGADRMHGEAKGKAPSRLSGKTPFVETISKGGAEIHRVRFGGFVDKEAAWAACAALEKKKMGCYALAAS